MPGEKDGRKGGRHAPSPAVGRRRLLKTSLLLGAAAVPGSAVLADQLLRRQAAPGEKAPVTDSRARATEPRASSPAAVPSPTRPPRAAGPLAGRLIVLDPGHNPNNIRHLAQIDRLTNAGGFLKPCNTVGTETDAGYPEYDFTLDVARRARVILRAAGARVVLTQNGHTPYGPCNNRRAQIANEIRADAAVAIHADGGPADGYGFAALVPLLVRNSSADNSAIIRPSADLGQAIVSHFRSATGEPLSTYLGADGIQPATTLPGSTGPRCRRCSPSAPTCATRATR